MTEHRTDRAISIAWYSWYAGRGYKGEQLRQITEYLGDSLCCCYGLTYPRSVAPPNPALRARLSSLPKYAAYAASLACKAFHLPNYYAYMAGTKTIGRLFANKLRKDASKVVYTNYLPPIFTEKAKQVGKYVVMEAGIMHPAYTKRILERDYEQYQIKSQSIFTYQTYVNEAVRALQMADRIITLSDGAAQTFIDEGIAPGKIKRIPMALSKDAKNISSADKPLAFIATAFHSMLKGTHRLLLAWEKAEIKEIPLIVVGELHNDMKEFVQKYGPFKNVQFVGTQNITEFYPRYRAIGILLSFSEGLPRSVVEYFDYGFPTIVSDTVASLIPTVKHEENGLIVDPLNEEAIIEALRYFADAPDKLPAMQSAAFATAQSLKAEDHFCAEIGQFLIDCAMKISKEH